VLELANVETWSGADPCGVNREIDREVIGSTGCCFDKKPATILSPLATRRKFGCATSIEGGIGKLEMFFRLGRFLPRAVSLVVNQVVLCC